MNHTHNHVFHNINGNIVEFKCTDCGHRTVKENTVLISTAQEFNNIRNNPTGYHILTADIDLSVFAQWAPIEIFMGTLNGNEFTISGMNITRTGASLSDNLFVGLFSQLFGKVQNLRISDSRIQVSSNHNGNGTIFAGILAGTMYPGSSVEFVRILNSKVIVHRSNSSIGGLTGYMVGEVMRYCWVTGIELIGSGDIGGIAGIYFRGIITLCFVESAPIRAFVNTRF